jgi:hypothetical protein
VRACHRAARPALPAAHPLPRLQPVHGRVLRAHPRPVLAAAADAQGALLWRRCAPRSFESMLRCRVGSERRARSVRQQHAWGPDQHAQRTAAVLRRGAAQQLTRLVAAWRCTRRRVCPACVRLRPSAQHGLPLLPLLPPQGYADLSDQREDFYNRRMYRRIHVSAGRSAWARCAGSHTRSHAHIHLRAAASAAAASAAAASATAASAAADATRQPQQRACLLSWRSSWRVPAAAARCVGPGLTSSTVWVGRHARNAAASHSLASGVVPPPLLLPLLLLLVAAACLCAGLLQPPHCQRPWRLDRRDGAHRHIGQSVR